MDGEGDWISNSRGTVCCLKSSRPEVFYKKGATKNFANSTGKSLCQSLFF